MSTHFSTQLSYVSDPLKSLNSEGYESFSVTMQHPDRETAVVKSVM